MKKVIFICKGNIFRSQTAQAFYNQLVQDGSRAESYGTMVEEEGNQDLKISLYLGLEVLFNILRKYNLDISNEHCKQLKEEYLKDADKIIVMTEREFIPKWLNKYNYEYWDIENPEAHEVEVISRIVSLLREKVLKLINIK